MALLKFGPYTIDTTHRNTNAETSAGDGGSGGSSIGGSLAKMLAEYAAKKGLKAGWNEYGQPAWDKFFSNTSTGGGGEALANSGVDAGTMGYEASPYYQGAAEYGTGAAEEGLGATAGTGAAEGAGEGLGAMGAGSWASVAAPIVMAYLKYQAGSGRNDPMEMKGETVAYAKAIKDMIDGKNVQESDLSGYGTNPAWLNAYDPTMGEAGPRQTLKTNIPNLWYQMHDLTRGGVNNTFQDKDINQLIYDQGVTPEQLQKALGTGIDPNNWAASDLMRNPNSYNG